MSETVMARLHKEDWTRFRQMTECQGVSSIALFKAVVDILEGDYFLKNRILSKAAEYRMPWGGNRSFSREVSE